MNEDELRGQLIARLREDRLWTREELARHAGVTPTTVTQAETGRTHVRLKTIGKLADALGVPASRLLRPGKAPAPRESGPPKEDDEAFVEHEAAKLKDHDLARLMLVRKELEEELARVREAEAEEVKQSRIHELYLRLLAVTTALQRKDWRGETETSERRRIRQPQRGAEDSRYEVG